MTAEKRAGSPRLRILIELAYDGSRFHGVQAQPGLCTVAGMLTDRLRSAAGQEPRALAFAARTDAGVHARQNLATVTFRGPLDVRSVIEQLLSPAMTDDGLVIISAKEVPLSVHARTVGRGKLYCYTLEDDWPADDLECPSIWRIHPRMSLERLQQAAGALVGTHDFSSFRGRGCSASTPIKTIWSVAFTCDSPSGGHRYEIRIAADAFLRRMVRLIVGTLVEVGVGLREPAAVAEILATRDRHAAGICAPARGLTLERILYDNDPITEM